MAHERKRSRRRNPDPSLGLALVEQSAASVDSPLSLVPHFDRLFAGFGGLGGSPRKTVSLLGQAGLRRRHKVIDLGCGKGATAIEIVRRIGARVTGVDACRSFVEAGWRARDRCGIDILRCMLIVGDLRPMAGSARGRYDAALMLGVAPIARAIPLARQCVRRGGLYAIDDAFYDPAFARPRSGVELLTRAQCRALFERRGDRILFEWVPPPSFVRRQNASIMRRLRRNARALEAERPGLKRTLDAFLKRQGEACRALEGALRPAVWVARRGR